MGKIKIWLYLLGVILICLTLFGVKIYQDALPLYDGVLYHSGPSNSTVYRDEYGIPHIHAENEVMGYYSLGFSMATDRLFQMDKLRKIAQGRLSELFGERTILADKALRNFGLEDLAMMTYFSFAPDIKEMFDDFTLGINDYADHYYHGYEHKLLGVDLKANPINWKPHDSVSIFLFTTLTLSEGYDIEFYRDYLYSKLQDEELVDIILSYESKYDLDLAASVITDDELKQMGFYKEELFPHKEQKPRKLYEFIEKNFAEELEYLKVIQQQFTSEASNWWAISGNHTKSGKPILVNDPHLDPSLPSPFYMAELNMNHGYFIGAMIPGVPMFVSGRNNYVAFGVTSLNADNSDLFEEKIEGDKYLFKGEWKDLIKSEQTIKVLGGEDVNITIRSTHHGPVLDYLGAAFSYINPSWPPIKAKFPISFSWIGYHVHNSLISNMHNLFQIRTIVEAIDHFKGSTQATFGICFADSSGNIAYSPISTYPKRDDDIGSSRGIKEGWTGEHEWNGFYTKEQIPHLLNPEKGYIFTSNAKVSSNHVEIGIGANIASNARAVRINQYLQNLIEKGEKISIDDMKHMLLDVKDVYAELKLPIMTRIIQDRSLIQKYIKDQKTLDAISHWFTLFENWNFEFKADMVQPTIFYLWDYYYISSFFKKQIPNDRLRLHGTLYYSFDNFIISTLQKLEHKPNYLSEYWQVDDFDAPEACVRNLVLALQSVYNYLVPEGTTYSDAEARYGNHHFIEYANMPFSSTPLKSLYHRTVEDSGSKNTINVGTVYMFNFDQNELRSAHTPNYRMVVDLGDDKHGFFSIETGISENILSGHYFDMNQAHFSADLILMNPDSLEDDSVKKVHTLRFVSAAEGEMHSQEDIDEVRQHF